MAKTSKPRSANKRVKVADIPSKRKKLTGKDMKKVKGGLVMADEADWVKKKPTRVAEVELHLKKAQNDL